MIALAIASLIAVTAIASGLTLIDCWLRARHAMTQLRRERSLLAAGFVPQVDHREMRLRLPTRREASRASRPSAPRARRLRAAA